MSVACARALFSPTVVTRGGFARETHLATRLLEARRVKSVERNQKKRKDFVGAVRFMPSPPAPAFFVFPFSQ